MPVEQQFIDNVSEGSSPGQPGGGLFIIPTFTFDLQRILGIPDARFRLTEEINAYRFGDNTGPGSFQDAADSGVLGTEKQNLKEGTTLRQLTYEQLVFNKRVDIEVGRMNLERYFWTPNCSIDSLTCLDVLLQRNAGLPPPAFSTWAGRAAFNVTRDVYLQGGIQEVNPHIINTQGLAFGLHDSTGIFVAGEVAYKSEFSTTPYPGEYEFGGWYSTPTHADPLNAKITRYGTSALQFWGDQTVWRQDGGATHNPNDRHVNIFFQTAKSLDNTSLYTTLLSVGANLYAPLKSRPLDIIGVQVTDLQLTHDESEFLAQQRHAAGGPLSFPVSSYYLGLNGHFQLYRYLAFEPVVQYVINPDTVFDAKVKTARSGWVVGATLVIDPARLLGLGG
jgi:porin